VHPVLFELPNGVAVQTYGVSVALAVLAGWYLWGRRHPRAYLGALVGGFPAAALVAASGENALELWGGVLAGAPVALWMGAKEPRRAAGALAFGVTLTSLGAWAAGARFGEVAGGELAELGRYVAGPALWHQVATGRVSADAATTLPTHPAMVYSAAWALLVFLMSRRLPARVSVALLAGADVGLCALRADDGRAATAVAAVVAAVAVWVMLRRERDTTEDAPAGGGNAARSDSAKSDAGEADTDLRSEQDQSTRA